MQLPEMTLIRQRFDRTCLDDVPGATRAALADAAVRIAPGASVAVAVGSRGIAHLPALVRTTLDWIRAQGGVPFIVPTMGSHGGATAAGQQAVLAGYGITEAAMGAPVRATMAVVELPADGCETPVYLNAAAAEADGIVLINRVKPHTSFRGRYESGLMKMLAIGLGNHRQALAIHALGVRGLREVMPRVAGQVLRHARVLLGLAVVENVFDDTLLVRALPAARIPGDEPALLDLARAHMPRLPVDDIDILIVDEMGKNISGLGMDPNIIGRLKIAGQSEPERPRIGVIIAGDLTAETHGNATGMGLADLVTRRFAEKIDYAATYANVITTGFLERGKLPLVAESGAQALEIAARALPGTAARVVRIHNTLHLDTLQVSAAVLDDLCDRVEVVGPAPPLCTADGDFSPW
jgi:hypothetical protein